MKNIYVIGDVHGKFKDYKRIVEKLEENSIQVGDFGFREQHKRHLEEINSNQHKVLFGNHDDYNFLNENHSLKNFHFNSWFNLFCVRGAESIDKYQRTLGLDFFAEEELSYLELTSVLEQYEKLKPDFVISHDCPQFFREKIFNISGKSRTSDFFNVLFEIHQPKLWVFGHHHKSLNVPYETTRFVCLGELEVIKVTYAENKYYNVESVNV